MDTALDGLRVLDLSDTIAGQYCTRLMADYGAEVWLIEPPAGSATRRQGPFRAASTRPDDSLLFWHLNTGKRSCVLDWRQPSGRDLVHQLARQADVVVADPVLADAELLDLNSRLIVCRLSEFGTSGPHAGWHGSEMIFQALSGVMLLNGEVEHVPLYGVGYRALYSCALTAYVAVLAALYARERTGTGQLVDVDVLETVCAMNGPAAARYLYNGTYQVRERVPSLVGLLKCRDSWLVLYAARPDDWKNVCRIFGLEEYTDDPRFVSLGARSANWQAGFALLQDKALMMTADTILEAARRNKVPVSRVMDPEALLGNEHLRARNYWESLATPEGTRTILGPAFRMGASPRHAKHGAPELGQHSLELYERIEIGAAQLAELREAGVA